MRTSVLKDAYLGHKRSEHNTLENISFATLFGGLTVYCCMMVAKRRSFLKTLNISSRY